MGEPGAAQLPVEGVANPPSHRLGAVMAKCWSSMAVNISSPEPPETIPSPCGTVARMALNSSCTKTPSSCRAASRSLRSPGVSARAAAAAGGVAGAETG